VGDNTTAMASNSVERLERVGLSYVLLTETLVSLRNTFEVRE
jgi:hypothetical protein